MSQQKNQKNRNKNLNRKKKNENKNARGKKPRKLHVRDVSIFFASFVVFGIQNINRSQSHQFISKRKKIHPKIKMNKKVTKRGTNSGFLNLLFKNTKAAN